MPIKQTLTLQCFTDWNWMKGTGRIDGVDPIRGVINCEKIVVVSNTATEYKVVRYFNDEDQLITWNRERSLGNQQRQHKRTVNNITSFVTVEPVDVIPAE